MARAINPYDDEYEYGQSSPGDNMFGYEGLANAFGTAVPVASPAPALAPEYVHRPSFQNVTGKGSTGFEPWRNIGRAPTSADLWDPFGNQDPYGGGMRQPGGILDDLYQFGLGAAANRPLGPQPMGAMSAPKKGQPQITGGGPMPNVSPGMIPTPLGNINLPRLASLTGTMRNVFGGGQGSVPQMQQMQAPTGQTGLPANVSGVPGPIPLTSPAAQEANRFVAVTDHEPGAAQGVRAPVTDRLPRGIAGADPDDARAHPLDHIRERGRGRGNVHQQRAQQQGQRCQMTSP